MRHCLAAYLPTYTTWSSVLFLGEATMIESCLNARSRDMCGLSAQVPTGEAFTSATRARQGPRSDVRLPDGDRRRGAVQEDPQRIKC